ncbi:MAG: GH92 family glycosyl hydrolase [Leadbetterella sp.]|nr:GH92 family glycosyl hydrolase [Leadbetterella sp.]
MGVYAQSPVDYVNPYMGNISHLLVPTFPTVHLPNSLLRVYPERGDLTGDELRGLPLMITSHRGSSAFLISPVQAENAGQLAPVTRFTYDHEVIKPYYYEVVLDSQLTRVRFAPSHQSAIYELDFKEGKGSNFLTLSTGNGKVSVEGNTISATQLLRNKTVVYIYGETDVPPVKAGILGADAAKQAEGKNATAVLDFGKGKKKVRFRYGISFIDAEQARANLKREIITYDLDQVAEKGKALWNETLGRVKVSGKEADNKVVFYTSLYRCFERPVNISEGNRYFSAFDGKVHTDSEPFYTDDWIWDSYRAAHPLRVLIDPRVQKHIIRSFIRMSDQMENPWFPTFPEVTGDSRRMNSNHGVAVLADAVAKGLTDFDIEKGYQSAKSAIREKTLIPWSGAPAGWLDDFYKKNGYIPALAEGEAETVPDVNGFEKRQPIAVTLGTAYDEWCLARLAAYLGKEEEAALFGKNALNYRNVYNPKTGFFHPKDKEGRFIEPFDYRWPGGPGAREYYGENNGWVYRWDVPHNVADLIGLMGGRQAFIRNLDQTFREPLGKPKYHFYYQMPDHTGNVGQFSMANEPSLHIPYLYNYAGQPWMTQKRIHSLLGQWFRNDAMGVPGDEDGGGMSSFVVFSMLGFYPATPGMPVYVIGSPFFEESEIQLENGKRFKVKAENYSERNKYIQRALLDGKPWDKSWFSHSDLVKGGTLTLIMGDTPNKSWAAGEEAAPPSFRMP